MNEHGKTANLETFIGANTCSGNLMDNIRESRVVVYFYHRWYLVCGTPFTFKRDSTDVLQDR